MAGSAKLLGMPERFVSEPIEPASATYDTGRMAGGEPGFPREFLWRGQTFAVADVLRSWRETGRCHNGSDELYLRKHWYEVRTTSSAVMKIYFERQPRGKRKTVRWFLYSINES